MRSFMFTGFHDVIFFFFFYQVIHLRNGSVCFLSDFSTILSAGIIGFSIIFGVILGNMGEEGRVMSDFFNILSEVTMKMIRLFMW